MISQTLPLDHLAIVAAVLLGLPSAAKAAITLTFVYNETSDVTTAAYEGTWDVSADNFGTFGPRSSGLTTTGIDSLSVDFYGWSDVSILSGAIPWNMSLATGRSGDDWGFSTTGQVVGPAFFSPSTVISGALIFAGSDLSELGFDASEIASGGSITGSGGTVNWSASVIPEPNICALAFVAFLSAGWTRRRR